MTKLGIGMYCYNKINRKLGIGKIISFQRNNSVNIKYKNDIELISVDNVVANHNIIDLIELDDYVNGSKVIYKNDTHSLGLENGVYINYADDIKSVVTKEQFASMEYKVGE